MTEFRFPEVPKPEASAKATQPEPADLQPSNPPQDEQRSSPRGQTKPRRRPWKYFVGGLCAALVVVLVVTAARLYPWLRGPDTPDDIIAARWAEVVKHAELPPLSGSDAKLLAAASSAAGFSPPAADPKLVTLVDRAQLTNEQSRAVAQFKNWYGHKGVYIAPACQEDSTPRAKAALNVYRLGQLVVHSATDADVQDVEAVLVLAQQLRNRGQLIDQMTGLQLAKLARDWSKVRDVELTATLTKYRPKLDELTRAIARDAVCVMKQLSTEDTTLLDMPSRVYEMERPPLGIVLAARERAIFRDIHGRTLQSVRAARGDHAKILAVFKEAQENRPKSILLHVTWFFVPIVERALSTIAAFDKLADQNQPKAPSH